MRCLSAIPLLQAIHADSHPLGAVPVAEPLWYGGRPAHFGHDFAFVFFWVMSRLRGRVPSVTRLTTLRAVLFDRGQIANRARLWVKPVRELARIHASAQRSCSLLSRAGRGKNGFDQLLAATGWVAGGGAWACARGDGLSGTPGYAECCVQNCRLRVRPAFPGRFATR